MVATAMGIFSNLKRESSSHFNQMEGSAVEYKEAKGHEEEVPPPPQPHPAEEFQPQPYPDRK
jgi:hypothetical protein